MTRPEMTTEQRKGAIERIKDCDAFFLAVFKDGTDGEIEYAGNIVAQCSAVELASAILGLYERHPEVEQLVAVGRMGRGIPSNPFEELLRGLFEDPEQDPRNPSTGLDESDLDKWR